MERTYYIYMMASKFGTLYIGVTAHLETRVAQHKSQKEGGFTAKYNCTKLVYYEEFQYVEEAILREKQLKKWRRDKKEHLINQMNPNWKDLAVDWGAD